MKKKGGMAPQYPIFLNRILECLYRKEKEKGRKKKYHRRAYHGQRGKEGEWRECGADARSSPSSSIPLRQY